MNTLPFLGLKRSHNSYLHDLAVAKETLDIEREEWEVERAHMLARISGLESLCTSRKERISGLLLANHRQLEQEEEVEEKGEVCQEEEKEEEGQEEEEGQAVAVENLDARKEWESERARVLAQISGLGACTCTHFDLLAQISSREKALDSWRKVGRSRSRSRSMSIYNTLNSEIVDLRAQLQANGDMMKKFGDPLTHYMP